VFGTRGVFLAALQCFVKLRGKIAFFLLEGRNRNFLKVKGSQMNLSH